jgi:hypothetical protein
MSISMIVPFVQYYVQSIHLNQRILERALHNENVRDLGTRTTGSFDPKLGHGTVDVHCRPAW